MFRRPKIHASMMTLRVALIAGLGFLPLAAAAQSIILSSNFTGVTVSGNTFNNITWSGTAATSSQSSLQAIRLDNNGTQPRSIVAQTTANAGYLTVSSGNTQESWAITVPFTATANVSASSLTLAWASSSGMASPGFGFSLYQTSVPTSNLNLVPFGGGDNALGYAITGTVQPSGTGVLSAAMTGNVTPVDAGNLASPQSITLNLNDAVALQSGGSYFLRVAVFENNDANNLYNPNIYLDSVALVSAGSAIPEPSTYAAAVGALALVVAVVRRRRRRTP
jgi:MYXO-CTERM domain-containing protein